MRPGDLLAQRHHARAGERGEVDHRGRLVLGRERERVGENQAPFGVGVEHLDRLAVADAEHVTGTDRGAARHVLDQRHVAVDARLHAQRLERRHRRHHGRATRHVALHRLHARAGLQRETSGVEDHALAHERERLPARAGRRVRELEEARALVGALPDTQHAAELQRLQLRDVHHVDGDAGAAQQLARLGRERGGRLLLRRQVDHVARPRDRVGDHRAALERSLDAGAARTDNDDLGELARCRLGLVVEELVRAEDHAFGERLRGVDRVERGGGVEQRRRHRRDLARTLRDRRPARRTPSSVSSAGSPIPTSTAALARSLPAVGTASVSPNLPSNPASSRNAARPPPSAASTTAAAVPGSRDPPFAIPTASRSAATRSAGVVTVENVSDTVPPKTRVRDPIWARVRVRVGYERDGSVPPATEPTCRRGRRAG